MAKCKFLICYFLEEFKLKTPPDEVTFKLRVTVLKSGFQSPRGPSLKTIPELASLIYENLIHF